MADSSEPADCWVCAAALVVAAAGALVIAETDWLAAAALVEAALVAAAVAGLDSDICSSRSLRQRGWMRFAATCDQRARSRGDGARVRRGPTRCPCAHAGVWLTVLVNCCADVDELELCDPHKRV